MLALVSKKKSELLAKSDRLEEQKEALVLQLDRHGAAGDDGSGVSDEEWRAKYEAIKAQLPAYKAMKKELGELEGEVGNGMGPAWGKGGARHYRGEDQQGELLLCFERTSCTVSLPDYWHLVEYAVMKNRGAAWRCSPVSIGVAM